MNLFPERVELSHTTEIDKWISEHHYLGNTPAGARLRLWILDKDGTRIGAMMWGRPNARRLNQETILELTRMVLLDEALPMSESKSLKLARSHIRKHFPKVKGLLAYSSTGHNHEGTIYLADNWFELGRNKVSVSGWNNRDGRDTKDFSEKIRWVRTP